MKFFNSPWFSGAFLVYSIVFLALTGDVWYQVLTPVGALIFWFRSWKDSV